MLRNRSKIQIYTYLTIGVITISILRPKTAILFFHLHDNLFS